MIILIILIIMIMIIFVTMIIMIIIIKQKYKKTNGGLLVNQNKGRDIMFNEATNNTLLIYKLWMSLLSNLQLNILGCRNSSVENLPKIYCQPSL